MAELSDTTPAASSASPLRRRDVLLAAGALTALAAAPAFAAESGDQDAHAGHGEGKSFEAKAPRAHVALVAATDACIGKGQACISHCFETFRRGDTTMADCAFAVQQMSHVCTAFAYLAAYDSKHLRAMAPMVHRGVRRLREGVPQARGAPARVQGLRRRPRGPDPGSAQAPRLADVERVEGHR